MSSQYGELRPISGWDRFVSLGHPCKFQLVSHLGSVTAQHSSSGRQPNFAALNRGRHLCSAGRPSRWALAHILVVHTLQWTAGVVCREQWKRPITNTVKLRKWTSTISGQTCASFAYKIALTNISSPWVYVMPAGTERSWHVSLVPLSCSGLRWQIWAFLVMLLAS